MLMAMSVKGYRDNKYELILADIEGVQKRLEKSQKVAKSSGEKRLKEEAEILQRLLNHLSDAKPARTFAATIEEREIVDSFHLLTTSPIIYAANVSESDMNNDLSKNSFVNSVNQIAEEENAEVVVISAKIEDEISQLDDEEKVEFLKELGFSESGLDRLIKAGYKLLGLFSYLTAGKPEVRAWTIKEGTKAPQAAGKIHSDFEKGFIKAEVVSYDDLVKYGSINGVKESGKLRLEGKEYIMREGDVVHFKFNI